METILLRLQELEKKDHQEEELMKLLLRDLSILKHKVAGKSGPSPAADGGFMAIPSRTASQSDTSSIETTEGLLRNGLRLGATEWGRDEVADGATVSLNANVNLNANPGQNSAVEESGEGQHAGQSEEDDDGDEDYDEDSDDNDATDFQIMPEEELNSFLQELRKALGPAERRTALTERANKHNWTCHQLCLLLPVLPFPEERVRAVSLISPKILDRQHRVELLNLYKLQPQHDRTRIMEAFDSAAHM